jgi:hypothetical protein
MFHYGADQLIFLMMMTNGLTQASKQSLEKGEHRSHD